MSFPALSNVLPRSAWFGGSDVHMRQGKGGCAPFLPTWRDVPSENLVQPRQRFYPSPNRPTAHAADKRQRDLEKQIRRTLTETPDQTIFASPMTGSKVLLVADAQNMSHSLRVAGYDCAFDKLLRAIPASPSAIQAHAYARLKTDEDLAFANQYFTTAGWQSHCRLAPVVNGEQRIVKSNVDNDLLLSVGELLANGDVAHLVVASGDGDLVCDVVAHIQGHRHQPQVHVLSIAGTTSSRFHALLGHGIETTTLLGWDCTGPAD